MFLAESDVKQWKEDLKKHDLDRKTAVKDAMKTQFNKPVTWRDVKQKEVEYHPILQKFTQQEKELGTQVKENEARRTKSEAQKKNMEKYLPEYNIINLEKDNNMPDRTGAIKAKPRLQPACQVDYNIITNHQLDDIYFHNVKLNVENKEKEVRKPHQASKREFNIISNHYIADHQNRTDSDVKKVENELHEKYKKTHDYNCLLGEFYDKTKENEYQDVRAKKLQEHGKKQIEKLPPTIKNRETIIFDPTREVPEAIKVLDQKKREAMKKYEIRYKVEEQLKERDFIQQDKTEEMKLKRINDKKYTEHLDKGFDIITMNDYDKSQLSYVQKPIQTKWEKLRLTSNNPVQTIQNTKPSTEKPSLTTSDLKPIKTSEIHTSNVQSPLHKGSPMRSEFDFNRMKEYKTAYERTKEPVYNLADKYNQYCVPPKRVIDDFNTRTLPQIKIADNSLKFSTTATGVFKKMN